ncbi:type II CRISPR RNA-guided endonuclease Cas9 [Lactovum odontotermitis]
MDTDANLKFSDEKYEDNLSELLNDIGNDYADLFEYAKNVNNAIMLSEILSVNDDKNKNSPTKLSASMVERYEEHQKTLKELKCLLKKQDIKLYNDYFYSFETATENSNTVIKANYAGYVGLPKASYRKHLAEKKLISVGATRKPFDPKFASEERFYKYTKTILEKLTNLSEANENVKAKLLKEIDKGTFLRKQRTFDNGSIPYQLQLHELKSIIANQKKVNPEFKQFIEKTFDKDESISNEAAIYSIFKFRIPYFVGPLRDINLASDTKQKSPWVVKTEKVRPWNFDKTVNQNSSAQKFIERMQNDDTYLYGEKTLPKNSLTYQKYAVLNELTKIRLDGDLIAPELRQKIFDLLFKGKSKNLTKIPKKVSKAFFKKFLKLELNLDVSDIKGMGENSDDENHFNNQFSTYQDLKSWGIPTSILDDEIYLVMLEEIIKVLTILPEDREMKLTVLKGIPDIEILDRRIIKELAKKSFSGYGRFSGKLLGLGKNALRSPSTTDGNGESWTIVDFLEKDPFNRNFMELVSDDKLTFKRQINESYKKETSVSFDDVVSELAGSPAIKRGILQSLKIVDELTKYMKCPPANIVIEMARENQTTRRGKAKSKTRLKVLQEIFNAQWREATNDELANEKLFLYYLQDCRDAYTGDPINSANLSNYDVDHIIPQSFIKDDSISNKVLTSSKNNRGKLDDVPSEEVARRMKATWDKWLEQKRIPKRKYDNLTKSLHGGLSDKDKQGFIARQLVETRQITKHVARILNDHFSAEDTKVITVKSALASQLRKDLELFKVREINDYHHAQDAYLNGVVALELVKNYPQIKGKFIYGEIDNGTWFKDSEKATKERNIWLNISRSISKRISNGSKSQLIKDEISKSANITNKLTDRASNEKGKELFKQTIARRGGKGANPISTKFRAGNRQVKLNVEDYGGYLEQKEAFITFDNGKLVSVKRTGIDDFKNAKLKIYRNQVFKTGKNYWTVSSLKESGKWTQLKLSQEQNNYIYGLETYDKVIKYVRNNTDSKIDKPFYGEDLVNQIEKNNGNIVDEIEKAVFKFIKEHELINTETIKKPDEFIYYKQKLEYILALLNIAATGTTSENKVSEYDRIVDEDTGEIKYQQGNSKNSVRVNARSRYNKLKKDSTLIYQSITGLYETRQKLQ